jgi:D-alanyl-D-alanine carboxypeptidase
VFAHNHGSWERSPCRRPRLLGKTLRHRTKLARLLGRSALAVLAIAAIAAASVGQAQAKPAPCRIDPDNCPTKLRVSSLPPLLTQAQIRKGKTVYGRCTAKQGKVTCPSVRLAKLRLPASFGVGRRRTVAVNTVALEVFRRVVRAIDRAGLGPRIKQFQTVNRRQCKSARTGKFIPGCVSLHSWGLAVDINPGKLNATKNGQPLAGVRKIFVAHGFVWGKTFKHNVDPPHFQYAKL